MTDQKLIRHVFVFICSLIFLNFFTTGVLAFDGNALNNKFGIHLAQPHLEDLSKVRDLVNSNGGDWGYITLVIQENDRDRGKWQDIFNRLREYHLIPIIRLATSPQGSNWRRPEKDEAGSWLSFLDSLNWVVKERYIVLFNEPNHASEWGGSVDPGDYAQVALSFAKTLKEKNSDFFVMLAGLDASAPSSLPAFEDEGVFLRKIINTETIEQWNNLLSGLASHSYPNPGFVGSPYGVGRGTIRTYQWELDLLKNLGVKDLPVFITETGWKRQDNLDETTVAQDFKIAFENVWLPNNTIRAVTPFIFDYQTDPFLGFSWKLPSDQVLDGQEFYSQYYSVQSINKVKGEPEQIEKGSISYILPKELVVSSNYNLILNLSNTGEAIWDKNEGYRLVLEGLDESEYLFPDIKSLKPNQSQEINFSFRTNSKIGKKETKVTLYKNDKKVIEGKKWEFELLPLPSITFNVTAYPKLTTNGDDFEIQIFSDKENLVFRKTGLFVSNGVGKIEDIQNILLGDKYRVVILRPYYLPRQENIIFKRENNFVKFRRMIPLDFNADGKFDLNDFVALLKNPRLIKLLIP